MGGKKPRPCEAFTELRRNYSLVDIAIHTPKNGAVRGDEGEIYASAVETGEIYFLSRSQQSERERR
jgi:hypothetical protein